jgi:hypothetical protein
LFLEGKRWIWFLCKHKTQARERERKLDEKKKINLGFSVNTKQQRRRSESRKKKRRKRKEEEKKKI